MIEAGSCYRSVEPLTVTVWLAIGAPVTIMGEGILPAGEPFTVTDTQPDYYGLRCRPVRYDTLHEYFVPQDERDRINRAYYNNYEGYILLIPPETIANQCDQVDCS